MKKYDHLRDKARKWRSDGVSLCEISRRLMLGKGTVHYWVKDIQKPDVTPLKPNQAAATRAFSRKCAEKRQMAYQEGVEGFTSLCEDPSFRDFVMLFLTEGYRRCRNMVAIANSNPHLVVLGHTWITRLTKNKVSYQVQVHVDQDLDTVKSFWAKTLGIDPESIVLIRKSNSGQLKGRKWRSQHGVLTVRVGDTALRQKLEAWMCLLQRSWGFGM